MDRRNVLLAIQNPYPKLFDTPKANAPPGTDELNMLLWITRWISKDDIITLYLKKNETYVVVELPRSKAEKYDKWIGAHEWKAFLKDVRDKDANKKSEVFYYVPPATSGTMGWLDRYLDERKMTDFDERARLQYNAPYPLPQKCGLLKDKPFSLRPVVFYETEYRDPEDDEDED